MTNFLSNYSDVIVGFSSCLLLLAIIKSVMILWQPLVEMIRNIGKKF